MAHVKAADALIIPASLFLVMKPHGRAFKVIDKERLMSEVLSKHCVCKKYESFTRQLNGWGELYRPDKK